ncbi:MAG: hypothetical protein CLLPBCKN_007243 [Chroococcidiopsis cubana SAG 39.79]|nr:hypothetical protein [Chroococcidiopsis cubana SAG 39.79]PSB66281.1 hypothetical protein C7B79_01900 [Chroococcidiopsis cubana CCALA 043]
MYATKNIKVLLAISFAILLSCTAIARTITPGTTVEVERIAKDKKAQKTDLNYESTPLIVNVLYRYPSSLYNPVSPDGASNANIKWEQCKADRWFIEEQRYAEERIIAGLLKNDSQAIQSGFKMFDWGFARQSSDGSFKGTGDPFHSTSFFVQAVARTLLVLQQSPQASKYAYRIARYKPLVRRAARWMILPSVWKKGIERNEPYAHRRYLVAAALGLTGKLTGDRQLIDRARQSIKDGLSLQSLDGGNPEKGGYDTSYQMVGVVYAQRWVTYFPDDLLTPKVKAMINKALAWEQARISNAGEISSRGNTRTGGEEKSRAGRTKDVSSRIVLRGFAYWGAVTGDSKWSAIARKIANYYHSPHPHSDRTKLHFNSLVSIRICNKRYVRQAYRSRI